MGMYKINKDFSQYDVKMLADVIEALIGAVFLDWLHKYRNEKDNDEEEKYIDSDQCQSAIDKVEEIWTNFFEKYLVLYTDEPVLPDKARYYSELDKLKYCSLLKQVQKIRMTPLDMNDIHDITNKKISTEKIIVSNIQNYKLNNDNNKSNSDVIQYVQWLNPYRNLYSFRLKIDKKEKTYFQIVYNKNFKKKEHDFYTQLYAHFKKIIEGK